MRTRSLLTAACTLSLGTNVHDFLLADRSEPRSERYGPEAGLGVPSACALAVERDALSAHWRRAFARALHLRANSSMTLCLLRGTRGTSHISAISEQCRIYAD